MIVSEKNIQLINIDAKLKELDQELGKDHVRACLFNFIIYSKKGGKDSFYEKLVQSVISKFPCRVIWIKENRENACLNTNVRGIVISSNIFCEIIDIEAGSPYMERVPSLLLPHLVPDLPIYLLWAEDPSQKEPIFPILAPIASKIIFDTSYIENLHDFYNTTLQLSKQFPGTICDLNWSHTNGWRHLFTATFNSPTALNFLINSKVIHIEYNTAMLMEMKHNEIRAAYFQGWLASCFQWKFQSVEKHDLSLHITYRHSTQDVVIILTPKQSSECGSLPSGALLSCEIDSGKAHYSFKRQLNSRRVFSQYSDDSHCELPFCQNLPGIIEGQEIIEEIFYGSEEKHFRNTLDIVARIPWLSK